MRRHRSIQSSSKEEFSIKRKPRNQSNSILADPSNSTLNPTIPIEQAEEEESSLAPLPSIEINKIETFIQIAEAQSTESDLAISLVDYPDDFLTPEILDYKLKSYGPYVRVYEKDRLIPRDQHSPRNSPSKDIPFKYTSGNTPSVRERLYSSSYPLVITHTSFGLKQVNLRSNGSRTSPPSTISLSRPKSSRPGPRYARSNPSTSSNREDISELPFFGSRPGSPTSLPKILPDPALPLLPFLQITNALQLHLKMHVLENGERLVAWTTGSFVAQTFPFVNDSQSERKSFSFTSLFKREKVIRILISRM